MTKKEQLHPLLIKKKTLSKSGTEENSLNVIKDIYKNLTAKIVLTSERLKSLP